MQQGVRIGVVSKKAMDSVRGTVFVMVVVLSKMIVPLGWRMSAGIAAAALPVFLFHCTAGPRQGDGHLANARGPGKGGINA